MKIIYFANCWSTNVGEAFIDIGAMHMLKTALPQARVICVTPMAGYYNKELRSRHRARGLNRLNPRLWGTGTAEQDAVNLGLYMDADLFVLGGMFATHNFPDLDGNYFVRPLFEKNKKIRTLFMGVGGLTYTPREIDKFSAFANEVMRPAGFITRDNKAYDIYKEKFPNAHPGIDCGFFCSDVYDPRGFSSESYDVMTFNRMKEPSHLFENWPRPVIRAEHMFYYARYKPGVKNYFISDCPHEYMTLYANAHEIHTDLVHGTILGLMYGRPVKYYHDSPRSLTFAAAGAVQGPDGFLSIPAGVLEDRKRAMIQNIRNVVLGHAGA